LPKVASATRSEPGFVFTNAEAAATASASGLPAIERESSIASTTFFERPRLSQCGFGTATPFSSRTGGFEVGTEVTTVAWNSG
jgi:hypothetical protein